MCFELDDPLGVKLGAIGEPMVIRCPLDPNKVKTYIEYPWGKILVSSFHALINPKANRIDQDRHQSVPAKPEHIVSLNVLKSES
ncbi:hypothetical protein RHO15_00990 [Utexia brackfieldae]|uniref:hypothetical protein n=1 Tax=Utexia brackfieldae TaxID=3074108 RepID=UPI00370D8D72